MMARRIRRAYVAFDVIETQLADGRAGGDTAERNCSERFGEREKELRVCCCGRREKIYLMFVDINVPPDG